MDLLTTEEEHLDNQTREFRFDIDLLADRLTAIVEWATAQPTLKQLPIGLFGASTGAAAALVAAAKRPDLVRSVVSRGGRPDLAGESLEESEGADHADRRRLRRCGAGVERAGEDSR